MHNMCKNKKKDFLKNIVQIYIVIWVV